MVDVQARDIERYQSAGNLDALMGRSPPAKVANVVPASSSVVRLLDCSTAQYLIELMGCSSEKQAERMVCSSSVNVAVNIVPLSSWVLGWLLVAEFGFRARLTAACIAPYFVRLAS